MTVRLRNTTDQVINYVPSFICVVEELNGSNGVQPVSNSMRRITLDPGQTQEVRFQAYMGPNQLNPKKFSKLESSTITLVDRKSTRLNSSHQPQSRMPSSA